AQGSITEYTNGVQDDPVISDGISFPLDIAIDGAGNIWVQNDGNNVTVYAQPVLTHIGVPVLVQTFGLTGPILGIGVSEGTFAWGTEQGISSGDDSVVLFASATQAIASGNPEGLQELARTETPAENSPSAIAADAKGNFYILNQDGQVNIEHTNYTQTTFAFLDFVPAGIAIDNARGRVYISNFNGDSIAVYNTSGKLIHTIE
ncbi:MAG: hypothetical protein ABSF53_25985, partial [Terracidiphilus sp.]